MRLFTPKQGYLTTYKHTKTLSVTFIILLLSAQLTVAGVSTVEAQPEEKALRVVPLLTSTPLTGAGVGLATSYLYRLDDTASRSRLQVGGQYSDTEGITLFIRNNAFFKNNDIIANTAILAAKTNSEFDDEAGQEVKYEINPSWCHKNCYFEWLMVFTQVAECFTRNPNTALIMIQEENSFVRTVSSTRTTGVLAPRRPGTRGKINISPVIRIG